VTRDGIEVISKMGALAWPFSAHSIKAAEVDQRRPWRPAEVRQQEASIA